MDEIEANLKRYLETEALLNAFFSSFDYCLSICIGIEMKKYSNKPVAACCTNRYYSLYDLDHPAFERLKEEREKRFGKPKDHKWKNPVSPCEYHNPRTGCMLTTHKSPVCIAFLCREAVEFLRNRYGICTYDYLGVNYALEWILTGKLPEKAYEEFKNSIMEMTEKVKKQKRDRLRNRGR